VDFVVIAAYVGLSSHQASTATSPYSYSSYFSSFSSSSSSFDRLPQLPVRCCHRKLHHHLHSLQYADFRGA
jgi:hypothetical protein